MIQGITAVSSRAILRDMMRKERGSGSKKITTLAVMAITGPVRISTSS
jgi:hypothetical protein